ncbi:MAG: hypothetical protein ABSD27_00275 [Bryobacteraceae bacterium]|jgi:hypothetical protein
MSSPAPHRNLPLSSALSEQREAVREQLSAAWQLQMCRIEEALDTGWREHIEQVLDERFAELALRLEAEFHAELERRLAAEIEALMPSLVERARRESSEELNRAVPAEPAEVPRFTQEEEELRLRAQRFARVRVAEMRLYRAQAVHAGRAAKRLYAELKEDIDSARLAFEREYLSASAAMPDYLHAELVRTLANDDLSALGPDYPGPLA